MELSAYAFHEHNQLAKCIIIIMENMSTNYSYIAVTYYYERRFK